MENTTLMGSVDPEILDAVDKRAGEIAQGASVNSKLAGMLALGSIPIALGALSKDVYGQTPSDVLDVLQFALLLEYLESDFYARGIAATGMIPTEDRTVFTTINGHEAAHVTALQAVIGAKSATPIAKPTFDYTAKGALAGFTFGATQYQTFLAVAMAFEDTGVRAYKGQAGRLINDKAVLNAALAIHSVEARHASQVRRMRNKKGWINGNNREDLPAFTQGIYNGEDNVVQNGVTITSLTGAADNGGVTAATEAWDEPLTKAEVTAIITPFLQ